MSIQSEITRISSEVQEQAEIIAEITAVLASKVGLAETQGEE